MSPRRVATLLWLVAWGFGSTAAAEPTTGRVRGVVFRADTNGPIAGVRVAVDGGPSTETSAEGAFRLALPPGEVVLQLGGADGPPAETPPLRVVAGHVTEVLATLDPEGGALQVRVEAPAALAAPERVAMEEGPRHRLEGVVRHMDEGSPVEGARIYVRGSAAESATDAEGRFALSLPEGRWDLTVLHPRFTSRSLTDVAVPPAEAGQQLEVALAPAAVQLQEFVVSAPRVEGGTVAALEERRDSAAVSDIVGAEQMSRSGDSDAASALERVTGVTLVGGRFVYVRGMGERYSSTLLNGLGLPSPDPTRRVVPLDMFPADILESIAIQKSWTADAPGDFGGGLVRLRTRTYPSETTAKVSLSTGATVGTTFGDGLAAADGPTDWLGIDGGYRALPDAVRAASEDQPLLQGDRFGDSGYTAEELEAFGEALNTGYGIDTRRLPPDFGLSASVGSSRELGPGRGGFLAALTYDNAWTHRDKVKRYFKIGADELAVRSLYDPYTVTTNTVGLNGILSLGYDLGEAHRLRSTTLVNRTTDDMARRYQGHNDDVGGVIRISRIRWVERMLVSQQLQGEHLLGGGQSEDALGFDWRYGFSVARAVEPDRRDWRYDLVDDAGTFRLSDRPEGNRRVFGDSRDTIHDLGADVTIPLALGGDWDLEVKTGAAASLKRRDVDTRRFKFEPKGPLITREVLELPIDEVFSAEFIGPDGFQLTETTLGTDRYRGRHDVFAAYGMATARLAETLELGVGLRMEHSIQRVETFDPFAVNPTPIEGGPTTTDALPVASARWSFAEDMQLRLALSRTVNRPNLRELAPAVFNEDTGGYLQKGNPDLESARLTHADLRWEWYPEAGESLSAGAFFKHLQDPIERVVVQGAQFVQTWQNAESARNLGLEIAGRKGLAFVAPALRDVYVAGNASWIASRVTVGADGSTSVQTRDRRALQGQSPYVLNFQLGYDDVDRGTRAAVLYNVSGRRIAEVGTAGAPDAYREAFHQLDVVVSQEVGAGFGVGFKAKNLVDGPVKITQGDGIREIYRKGRAFSLSLSKRF